MGPGFPRFLSAWIFDTPDGTRGTHKLTGGLDREQKGRVSTNLIMDTPPLYQNGYMIAETRATFGHGVFLGAYEE